MEWKQDELIKRHGNPPFSNSSLTWIEHMRAKALGAILMA